MSEANTSIHSNTNTGKPLDIIEEIADDNEWISDRQSDVEIAVKVYGYWCDYSMFFAWNDTVKTIHFSCAFDMRVPTEKQKQVHELLALINEKLWIGHFGIWDEEGLPMFRHTLPLRGTNGPSKEQLEDIAETAILECDRFYPTFQYVIWGNKSAEEAVALSIVDTIGTA